MVRHKPRPDFCKTLVHLTRPKCDVVNIEVKSAFDVLKQILASKKIKGSGNDGYVKGDQTAVCLSEIPLAGIKYLVQDHERYSYYGIMITKKQAYKNGGRPVIYLRDSEAGWIPDQEKWRHVRFEPPEVDLTHEREWRIKGNLSLSGMPFYVLVWEAEERLEIECEFSDLNIRSCLIMRDLVDMF